MEWKFPPRIKIYEALGCLADGRLEEVGSEIRVYSSSRTKYYTVSFDEPTNAIMANDNGSYWACYLGYPSIAYLMKIKKLPFDGVYAEVLKGISWKELNKKHKNNFEKSIREIDQKIEEQGLDIGAFHRFVDEIMLEIASKKYILLGKKQRPPKERYTQKKVW